MSEVAREEVFDTITVTTGRKLIEKERKRLQALRQLDTDWWESPKFSGWAREQFGETLTEKSGDAAWSVSRYEHRCTVCGRVPGSDDPIVMVDSGDKFEGCDIVICENCFDRTALEIERVRSEDE